MPEIRDLYADLKELELPALHERRHAILARAERDGTGQPNYGTLSDEDLAQLLAITRQLRIKSAIGTRTRSAPKRERASESLESLL
jgi:hypothetical protein